MYKYFHARMVIKKKKKSGNCLHRLIKRVSVPSIKSHFFKIYGGDCLKKHEKNILHTMGRQFHAHCRNTQGCKEKILHWQEQWHSEEHFVFIAVLNNLFHIDFAPVCHCLLDGSSGKSLNEDMKKNYSLKVKLNLLNALSGWIIADFIQAWL